MSTIAHKDLKIDPEAVYSETNEWMKPNEYEIIVGITDYAQAAMRGMMDDEHLQSVYVLGNLKVGDTVDARDVIGEVHSSKTSSEIYTPVSGEIVAINGIKEHGVHLVPVADVESDPYGKGWLIKILPSGMVRPMCTAEDYAKQSEKEYAEHYGGC
jgi:glycine cleavage system H protein